MRSSINRFSIVFFAALLFLGGALHDSGPARGAEKNSFPLPGDIKEGWRIFNQKKCVQCHSIWGEGGKVGPDLASPRGPYSTPSEVVALMWNHGPEMWAGMVARKIPLQKFDMREMANLFAFLYFVRYMDEPGDPRKGRDLLESKGCIQCHPQRDGGRDLNRWGAFTNPIIWATLMWNHVPRMEEEMRQKGIPRIEFSGGEMVDLITYIRSLDTKVDKNYLSPGDSRQGEKLFSDKGCAECHQPGGANDLGRKKLFPRTLGNLAGAMWNHSNIMEREMARKGMKRPALTAIEIADIVAYLFLTRYFDEPGSLEDGKAVFMKKQCHTCHRKGSKAPDLSRLKGQVSPIFMALTMWNHGPAILDKMRGEKIPWPKFYGREMADLMEYLNQGTP